MVGLIPQSFIDELVSRADIVEIIDARVPLKKAGRDLKACCPFHDEKTPSFTVSPSKQFYHCFGCGAHGTVLRFLMDYERLEFVEAVEELAQRLGMEVPRDGGTAPDIQQRARVHAAYAALEHANAWYKRQLREHEAAPRATEYLKKRGMSGRTAAAFELGFAPPGWDNLLKSLGGSEHERQALRDAGLLADKVGSAGYDRFRDRIVFPIHDRRARVVGFGARTIADDEPKYLNSPETQVFHKGRELYGLHQQPSGGERAERLVVVEGYMDVVMLAEHGVRDACATLGTAATPDQIERLFRVTSDVVFCFDGDAAGRRAAWRALENALPLMRDGRRARFAFLPEGEDPDSFVRSRGKADFEGLLADAPTLTGFLFDELRRDADIRSVEGRARLVETARPLIGRLPDGALKTLAAQRLSEIADMSLDRVEGHLGIRPASAAATTGVAGGVRRGAPAVVSPARRAVTLLLHHPGLAMESGDVSDLKVLDTPGADLLSELIEALSERPNLTTGGLVERFRDHPQGSALARLAATEPPELSPALLEEFKDCLTRIRQGPEEARFQALRQREREGQLSAAEREEFLALIHGRTQRPG